MLAEIAAAHPDRRVEVWTQDEARFGQQGTTSRVWARRGSRPRGLRQTEYQWLYLFAAVGVATGGTYAWMMPYANVEAMNFFLERFSTVLAPDVQAVLLLDQAGWHMSTRLKVPGNITLVPLPPKSPELNPSELPWRECRQKHLSNRRIKDRDELYQVVGDAWNRVTADPAAVRSLCGFPWILSAVNN